MEKARYSKKQSKFQRGTKVDLTAVNGQIKAYLDKRAKSSHVALSKLARQELKWLKNSLGAKSVAATKTLITPPPSLSLIEAGVHSQSKISASAVPAVPDLKALLTNKMGNCYFRLNSLPGILPAPNWQRPPVGGDGSELIRNFVAASHSTAFLQAVTWKDDPDLTEQLSFNPENRIWDVIDDGVTVSKKLCVPINVVGFIAGNDGTGSSDVEVMVPIEVGGYTFGFPPSLDFEQVGGAGIAQLNARLVAMYTQESFRPRITEHPVVNLACHVISPVTKPGTTNFGTVYHESTQLLRLLFRARSDSWVSLCLNIELTIGVSRESNLILGAVFRDPLSRVERNFVHVPWILICETGEPHDHQSPI